MQIIMKDSKPRENLKETRKCKVKEKTENLYSQNDEDENLYGNQSGNRETETEIEKY